MLSLLKAVCLCGAADFLSRKFSHSLCDIYEASLSTVEFFYKVCSTYISFLRTILNDFSLFISLEEDYIAQIHIHHHPTEGGEKRSIAKYNVMTYKNSNSRQSSEQLNPWNKMKVGNIGLDRMV